MPFAAPTNTATGSARLDLIRIEDSIAALKHITRDLDALPVEYDDAGTAQNVQIAIRTSKAVASVQAAQAGIGNYQAVHNRPDAGWPSAAEFIIARMRNNKPINAARVVIQAGSSSLEITVQGNMFVKIASTTVNRFDYFVVPIGTRESGPLGSDLASVKAFYHETQRSSFRGDLIGTFGGKTLSQFRTR